MVDSKWYVDVTNLVYCSDSTSFLHFPTNHILSRVMMIPHDGTCLDGVAKQYYPRDMQVVLLKQNFHEKKKKKKAARIEP